MKRMIACFTAVWLMSGLAAGMRAHALDVSAQSAVLLCAETGDVLYAKQAHTRLPMASTTKIMTALLTLEEGAPQRVVRVTAGMVRVEGTSMGLLPDDSVTLYALACGMLLSSGNDAANTAAIALAGSVGAFCDRMNARAAEIGMTDTHFATPSGLDGDAHYSTAYDMALLSAEAIRNPVFRSICSARSLAVSYGNPPYRRTLHNHNRLLQSFDGCIGVKTGFTRKSGRCLVSAAVRGGVTLIAVTLDDPDDWRDHTAMLEYGFSALHTEEADADLRGVTLPVVGSRTKTVPICFPQTPRVVSDADGGALTRSIYIRPFLYAPVEAGKIVGRAVYSRDGKVVCTAVITTAADAAYDACAQPERKSGFTKRLFDKIKGAIQAWHNRFACKNTFPNAALPPGEKRRK